MPHTIRVKGRARLSCPPDQIELSLTVKALDLQYDKAMEQAVRQQSELQQILVPAGFRSEDLKTESFHVSSIYRNENSTQVFKGYEVRQEMQLRFALDTGRLSQLLALLADAQAHPEIRISFTVRDPQQRTAQLLQQIAADARQKAQILCSASAVQLGDLVSISYDVPEQDFISPTDYAVLPQARLMKAAAPDFQPEDIVLEDSAVFVWEIR